MSLIFGNFMGQSATLHLLYSCPFCWKVRGLIEYLKMDVEMIPVNGLKIKKAVSFAGDWGKVPVFTDENGEIYALKVSLVQRGKYGRLKCKEMGNISHQWIPII